MLSRLATLLRMSKPTPENPGLLHAHGKTVPTDGTAGYLPGCIFQHIDGTAGSVLYVNEGTASSCDFNVIESPETFLASDLADVGALAYTAGKILVADGDSYEEVAVSNHATLASNGALTLATAAKTFTVPLTDLRQEDAGKDFLPDTPDGDGGTLGLADTIGSPVVGTSTNNTSATEKCAFDFVVPADYVAGNDLTVRVNGLVTAAANATSNLDVVAKLVKGGALDATDLCTTGPIDMKDVTAAANEDFTIDSDASGDELAPGSVLHVEISFTRDDTGGSTAGTTQINAIQVLVPCYR